MQLKTSPLISKGMVMQAGAAFPVCGVARAGAAITVTFSGKTYHAAAGDDGCWKLSLGKQKPGGPHQMSISAEAKGKTEKIEIDDIYCGDVWLCAGQSNMELTMDRLKDTYPEEWQPPVNALIRQFKVPQESDFSGPRRELAGGSWITAAPETLRDFSGTAWFFAKKLYENHPVPMGLVATAWGGTPIESWMSRKALAGFPLKIAEGDQYANAKKRNEITTKTQIALEEWETNCKQEDIGIAKSWYKPQTNLTDWKNITLPGDFAGAGLKDFCGVIWLCREFDVTANLAARDAKVWLGTITDADTVYLNGVEVGGITYRYPPRKYDIPAGLLRKGTNRIVIRVTCNNGDGGITTDKPFRIFSGDTVIELAGAWKYNIGVTASARPAEFFFQRQPMGNYNAMIAPILRFPLKGVIWYQGESNDGNAHEYTDLFISMIRDWRKTNRNAGLPFLFVQLPIFGQPEDDSEESSWGLIREAQCGTLALPMTGMAAGLDLGEWNDLHPFNKKDIGGRLALAAEKLLYHEDNSSPGPVINSSVYSGRTLLLQFENCAEGLCTLDGQPPCITIITKEGSCSLPAEIYGADSLLLKMHKIKNPRKALYAWANNPRYRQIYNSEGLPVIPFRIWI
jgi:sialate O-acetylesterase